MKKFNLKKALAGEAVATRGGCAVILTGAGIGGAFILCGVVSTPAGFDKASWTIEGRYLLEGESALDLFML